MRMNGDNLNQTLSLLGYALSALFCGLLLMLRMHQRKAHMAKMAEIEARRADLADEIAAWEDAARRFDAQMPDIKTTRCAAFATEEGKANA
jgi:hypothetical protein